MTSDLSTSTLPELIGEIQARADASLIVFLMPDKTGDTQSPQLAFSGGLYTALGLCKTAQEGLIRTIFDRRHPVDGDPPGPPDDDQ